MLPASHLDCGSARYDFRDLIAARTAIGLLESGVRARHVREALEALRAIRPDLRDPLASLRVFSEGGKLVVRLDDALVEPVSGQTVLDLRVGELAQAADDISGNVIDVWSRAQKDTPDTADAWFERGIELEARDSEDSTAERCYQRAIELDPEHPGALLNLGNILYARGDLEPALELYRATAHSAAEYPEAFYNIANVLDDLDRPSEALEAYREALSLAPEFKAAHFNIALVLEKRGERRRARRHWQAYLDLDDESTSADIARSFLADDEAT